ncbi:MAG: DUF167 domain-containing protein [Pyrinomonadaceae bacterium]|nr:DUF167 domain-containing protein [Pyrinomonadaceae bacterium]
MIACEERNGAIHFAVRVVPRAACSAVMGEHDTALRVRLAAPPVDGAANEELIRLLADVFGVPSRAVEITSGHTSKLKRVRVRGVSSAALQSLAAVG